MMTVFSVFLALWLLLAAVVATGAWLCFKRTGIRSFLFLGAVLILWPWFDGFTKAVGNHFLDQVMQGHKPWLFPFSLIVPVGPGRTGWQMSPGEFLTMFNAAKEVLLFLLLAIAFACIARSLKKLKAKQTEPQAQ